MMDNGLEEVRNFFSTPLYKKEFLKLFPWRNL
jgi:hypothetical protein